MTVPVVQMEREAFVRLVAKCARDADLNASDAAAVVGVAMRGDRFAVGAQDIEWIGGPPCGCPLTQAGLWSFRRKEGVTRRAFWTGFDDAMRATGTLPGDGPWIVEVS
jgi:hypothetical protein